MIRVIFLSQTVFGQSNSEITLDQLQAAAQAYYPILKQKELYAQLSVSKKQALNTNYLPQIALVGSATFQSEVTNFNFSIPGVVPFSQKPDQYSFGVELKENIFDYGAIKTQKSIESMLAEIQNKQLDAEFIKVKERIDQLFATLQLSIENRSILQSKTLELEAKQNKIASQVRNGAALKSNLLSIEAELLLTSQRITEVESTQKSCLEVLMLLTNQKFDSTTKFIDNQKNYSLKSTNNRPEFALFDLQKNTNILREKMITKTNLPKLYVFGRGYFGRPGYNFLNNDFRTYGMIGAGLSWNISGYYTTGKEKKNLQIASSIVTVQKETFELNLNALLIQQKEELLKLDKMIEMDLKIEALKKEILAVSSSQLDNGTITTAEYIIDLNADQQARSMTLLHKVQLMMVKRAYNTTLGY